MTEKTARKWIKKNEKERNKKYKKWERVTLKNILREIKCQALKGENSVIIPKGYFTERIIKKLERRGFVLVNSGVLIIVRWGDKDEKA